MSPTGLRRARRGECVPVRFSVPVNRDHPDSRNRRWAFGTREGALRMPFSHFRGIGSGGFTPPLAAGTAGFIPPVAFTGTGGFTRTLASTGRGGFTPPRFWRCSGAFIPPCFWRCRGGFTPPVDAVWHGRSRKPFGICSCKKRACNSPGICTYKSLDLNSPGINSYKKMAGGGSAPTAPRKWNRISPPERTFIS